MRPSVAMLVGTPLLIALFGVGYSNRAQAQLSPTGDFAGNLEGVTVILHIRSNGQSNFNCTLDLPDHWESGIECQQLSITDQAVSFTVPSLGASFAGEFSADAIRITGNWSMNGQIATLTVKRSRFEPAQKPSRVDGAWQGTIQDGAGGVLVLVHVKSDHSGKEYVTLDCPDQDLYGAIATHVQWSSDAFSFDLPIVPAHFGGTIQGDGSTISGIWGQGLLHAPLNLTRLPTFHKTSSVDGDWSAVLTTRWGNLRAVMRVESDDSHQEYVVFFSPDQEARHILGTNVVFKGLQFSFDMPGLQGSYTGALSKDGRSIEGTWTQGESMPLSFARAADGTADDRPQQAESATAPLSLPQLHQRLDNDLKPLFENPKFAGMPQIGVAIGLYQQGDQQILTYGTANTDSIFEIGAVTETFTGLMFARLVTDGDVALDAPLRTLLTQGKFARPDGPEISALGLATFHSGIGNILEGFHPSQQNGPFAGYSVRDMLTYLEARGLAVDPPVGLDRNHFGIAVLGEALTEAKGQSYAGLLENTVLQPLHLSHTYLTLPPDQTGKLLPGHLSPTQTIASWNDGALSPAIGLKSNITDMLAYARDQLAPPEGEVARAVALQHETRDTSPQGYRFGLAWAFDPSTGNYFSYGHTAGFTSSVFFNVKRQFAVVVLVNSASERWAQNIGYRIQGYLEGSRAYAIRR